jgi:hypothetical protein
MMDDEIRDENLIEGVTEEPEDEEFEADEY